MATSEELDTTSNALRDGLLRRSGFWAHDEHLDVEKKPEVNETLRVSSGSVRPNIRLGGLVVGMDHAHEKLVEVLKKGGGNLFL